ESHIIFVEQPDLVDAIADDGDAFDAEAEGPAGPRSEERRVGKERRRPLDLLRSIEQFNREDSARFVVIKNQNIANFVAFSDLSRPKDDRKRVCLFVVNDFHDGFQYFAILLVL